MWSSVFKFVCSGGGVLVAIGGLICMAIASPVVNEEGNISIPRAILSTVGKLLIVAVLTIWSIVPAFILAALGFGMAAMKIIPVLVLLLGLFWVVSPFTKNVQDSDESKERKRRYEAALLLQEQMKKEKEASDGH